MRQLKRAIFSLIPVLVIVVAAEGLLRIFAKPLDPQYKSLPLPWEGAGVSQFDDQLFWAMKPNLDVVVQKTRVRTNSLGLRTPEVEAKKPGEFRVLSLGESTTLGAGVSNEETYSAVLADLLRDAYPGRPITVINAGVEAYSSFQSLLYLKTRGLALQPDLVLFYHELNDYLPSSLRDSKNNEIGISKSDKQLYESKLNRLSRFLIDHSAIYGGLYYAFARRQLNGFQKTTAQNPILAIGLPDISLPPRIREVNDGKVAPPAQISEKKLPSRVLPEERLHNLMELKEICDRNHIPLIVLHPSYMYTGSHECMLTQFCREQGVPMVETFSALHPEGNLWEVWSDTVHPNAVGHKRLAELLLKKIESERMMEARVGREPAKQQAVQ